MNLQEIDTLFAQKYKKEIPEIYTAIQNAKKILLISHEKPDGDTSGSAMAMAEMLEGFGKNVSLFDSDVLADEFHFLPKASEYIHAFDINEYDLAIAFDGGTYKMFGLHEKYPELFDKRFPLINIDHHISNEIYGTWNIVENTDASTTIVVSKLFRALGWNISPKIATPLLMGLYTDTGSLMHSNATPHTHREASYLLAHGADLQSISKNIFQTKPLQKLKLWGKVLSRIEKNSHGVTSSYIRNSDFKQTNTSMDDLTGVVDYLNSVPDSKFSLLLTERGSDRVKGSLRTLRNDIDLTQIAGVMGGGGHKKASGFTVTGDLFLERQWKILERSADIPENFSIVEEELI